MIAFAIFVVGILLSWTIHFAVSSIVDVLREIRSAVKEVGE
jgi:hypothetical protein